MVDNAPAFLIYSTGITARCSLLLIQCAAITNDSDTQVARGWMSMLPVGADNSTGITVWLLV